MADTTEKTEAINRYSVFVPGDFPIYTYIKRQFSRKRTGKKFDPESEIKNALRQKGIIAQVVGPSKSGKTRAVENCIGNNHLISIPGSQITESLTLWDITLRVLNSPTSTEKTNTTGSNWNVDASVTGSGDIWLAEVEAEVSGTFEHEESEEETKIFLPDSFHEVTKSLKEKRKVLFLDDFHTIPNSLQKTVAAQLKAAAQLGVKICLAEVPHHSDSTISALPDLTGRIRKISFNYWDLNDLIEIWRVGFHKLGANVSSATLEAFAQEAAGSPQLMQMICLNAAEDWDIDEVINPPRTFQADLNEIREILITTHETVDREQIFNVLDQGPDERGKERNKYPIKVLGQGDNYEIALAAISLSPPRTSLTWNNGEDNLLARMDKICLDNNNRPAKAQITRALEQMESLARTEMPTQSILEWDSSKGLHILDPYFLFHLRWSEKYEPLRNHDNDA